MSRRRTIAGLGLVALALVALLLVALDRDRAPLVEVAPSARGGSVEAVEAGLVGGARVAVRDPVPEDVPDAVPTDPAAPGAEREHAIRGRVRFVHGEALWTGVHVLAYERGATAPGPRAVREALDGTRALHVTQTDGIGRFVLEGLRADRTYSLCAGGNGYLSETLRGVRVGPDDVDVRIRKLFGALIELQDEDGGPVRISSAFDLVPCRVWSDVSGAEARATWDAVLAGIDPELVSGDLARHLVLFLWDSADDRMGPNHIFVNLPGYVEDQLEFDAAFVGAGIEVTPWRLRRAAPGFGSLRVRFVGCDPDVLRGFDEFGGRGWIELSSESGRKDDFPVRFSAAEVVEIPDLPHGTYTAVFRARNQLFASPAGGEPPRTVHVGEQPAVLEVDMSRAGAFEIAVADADGVPYRGGLVVMNAAGAPRANESGRLVLRDAISLRAETSPLRVGPVNAGDYTVVISRPRIAPEDLTDVGALHVVVPAGRLERVSVTHLPAE